MIATIYLDDEMYGQKFGAQKRVNLGMYSEGCHPDIIRAILRELKCAIENEEARYLSSKDSAKKTKANHDPRHGQL
jgi:hypothetical protein